MQLTKNELVLELNEEPNDKNKILGGKDEG